MMQHQHKRFVAKGLARAWLSTTWTRQSLLQTGARVTDFRPSVLRDLVDRILVQFPDRQPPPRFVRLVRAVLADPVFERARPQGGKGRRLRSHSTRSPPMQPGPAAHDWGVPPIETVPALAEVLGVSVPTLDGWADAQNRSSNLPDRLLHYVRYWRGDRLVEAPKAQLKKMQAVILRRIVDGIPPHHAAHGFVKNRSIVTHARGHIGQAVVLKCDLRRFFNSIRRPRVQGVFHYAGYPEPVAHVLASLCTTVTPYRYVRTRESAAQGLLLERHLPQGAPTSPALANLVAHALDRRLTGLADAVGVNYSRYADDLTFSGGPHLRKPAFLGYVRRIVIDEGFLLNDAKTRYAGRSGPQRTTGLTVNERPNLLRDDFDRLKAILHNCCVYGPASQNRERHSDFRAHLEGRVAFATMVNPTKVRRLRRLLAQIDWPCDAS